MHSVPILFEYLATAYVCNKEFEKAILVLGEGCARFPQHIGLLHLLSILHVTYAAVLPSNLKDAAVIGEYIEKGLRSIEASCKTYPGEFSFLLRASLSLSVSKTPWQLPCISTLLSVAQPSYLNNLAVSQLQQVPPSSVSIDIALALLSNALIGCQSSSPNSVIAWTVRFNIAVVNLFCRKR